MNSDDAMKYMDLVLEYSKVKTLYLKTNDVMEKMDIAISLSNLKSKILNLKQVDNPLSIMWKWLQKKQRTITQEEYTKNITNKAYEVSASLKSFAGKEFFKEVSEKIDKGQKNFTLNFRLFHKERMRGEDRKKVLKLKDFILKASDSDKKWKDRLPDAVVADRTGNLFLDDIMNLDNMYNNSIEYFEKKVIHSEPTRTDILPLWKEFLTDLDFDSLKFWLGYVNEAKKTKNIYFFYKRKFGDLDIIKKDLKKLLKINDDELEKLSYIKPLKRNGSWKIIIPKTLANKIIMKVREI